MVIYEVFHRLMEEVAMDALLVLEIIGVVSTTVFVYTDAKQISDREERVSGLRTTSAAGWAIACILLWIVAFPVYLARRGSLLARTDGDIRKAASEWRAKPEHDDTPFDER